MPGVFKAGALTRVAGCGGMIGWLAGAAGGAGADGEGGAGGGAGAGEGRLRLVGRGPSLLLLRPVLVPRRAQPALQREPPPTTYRLATPPTTYHLGAEWTTEVACLLYFRAQNVLRCGPVPLPFSLPTGGGSQACGGSAQANGAAPLSPCHSASDKSCHTEPGIGRVREAKVGSARVEESQGFGAARAGCHHWGRRW